MGSFFNKLILSFLFLLYAFVYIHAQNIQFSHYTVKDGLSQGTILCSLQDKNGYLWFGTADGLNCFNGYEFKVYRNNLDNTNSLLDNEIMSLVEDEHGDIWIGTALGLCKFSPKYQQFTRFQHEETDSSSLSNSYVNFLFKDKEHQIWVGTQHGLNLYNASTNNFTRFYQKGNKNNFSIDRQQVNSICQDKNEKLWIGFEDGLCVLEDNILLPAFEVYDIAGVEKEQKITTILCDSNGELWIGSEQTLCWIDLAKRQVELVAKKHIHTLLHTKNGTLWVGTNDGLLLVNKDQQRLQKDPQQLNNLTNKIIYSILRDNQGNIWVGTGSGLCRYNPLTSQFHTTQINDFNLNAFSHNKIWAIAQGQEGILLGTEGGLYEFDLSGSIVPHTQFSNLNISAITIQGPVIWLGTWDDGLVKWNTKTGKHTVYKHHVSDSTSINANTVRSIAIDKTGKIWIGTSKGLNRYHQKDDRFEHFQFHTTEGQNLKTNSVITIYFDKSGMIWLGTEGGVVCFREEEEEINIFRADATMPNSLSHDFVRSIFQSKDGTIWLGTSGGLNKWSMDKMAFTTYRMKDGLPNDVIYSILEAEDGILWLSTNKGLSRFDTNELSFLNFDSGDGVQGSEFNTNAALKGKEGRLFFGGLKGFNYFFPENIKTNPVPPSILINSIDVLNKSSKKPVRRQITPNNTVELSYKDYAFTFHFVALNFTNPSKNQYQYMLEGFDLDWSDIGTKRTATYTNLQKGNYLFKVRAANNSGVWNEEISSVKVHIKPPFWLTKWFATLMAVLLILKVLIITHLRVRNVEKRNLELEQLVQERTASLSEKQEILTSREALFRSFYEGSPLGIIYINGRKAGEITRCNAQIIRMLGYSHEEIVGSQMIKYVHQEDLKKKANKFLTTLQQKKELETFKECRLFKKNGEIIYTNVYSSFHYDKDKQLNYIIGMLIDVTEDLLAQQKLKKAEEQLIESNKMAALGQLTAGVAHEINNPVNFIHSGISSLKRNINALLDIVYQYDKLETGEGFSKNKPLILAQKKKIDYDLVLEDIDGLMTSIKNGANRTTEIVKSLQTFSRKDKVTLQRTNIHHGIDATLHVLKKEFVNKVEIEKKYDAHIGEIECYPGQLNQVFLNIILNATQAITEKGMIIISTKKEAEQIHISIVDNGPGISTKILARIFEPFFTTKEVGKGTGLGLSICYNIIKKHKGSIKVNSTVGKGTTFLIRLPISQKTQNTSSNIDEQV